MPADAGSGSFAGGYAGSTIEAWWQQVLRSLPGRRHWLDLATGNGAVPRWWLGHCTDEQARMDAVDLATIHVPWAAGLPAAQQARLHWHSGVSIQALPFASGSLDVVTSQYGVEYTELTITVPEILRVLAPAGALRWVLHHQQSRPVTLARAECAHIDELLAHDGLWTRAQAMIAPMVLLSAPNGRDRLARDAVAQQARQHFDDAQARVQAQAQASPCPDVLHETQDAIASVLQRAVQAGSEAALALADRWQRHLADSRLRLQELVQHALDDDAMARLMRQLDAAGLQSRIDRLSDGPHLMAWSLLADRRP